MIRVVILGGGYVSVWACRSIVRKINRQVRKGEVQITVISTENYHAYHGWSGEVLGGIIPLQHQRSSLRNLFPHVRFIRGEATAVDLEASALTVRINGEASRSIIVSYDHLLFGLGSGDHNERINGSADNGFRLKDPRELLKLRNHLIDVMEQAEAEEDERIIAKWLTVVVAGGGFEGVEICAAIAELFHKSKKHYSVLRNHQPRVVLVHAGTALLPQFRPHFNKLADYATAQLRQYGVEIRFQEAVESIGPEGARFSTGEIISSRTVIAAVGQKLMPLRGSESLPRDKDGRLLTDSSLNIVGNNKLWAGGDIANVKHYRTGKTCPPNALWAIYHGKRTGDNIARSILDKPLRPFRYPGLGQAASMGVGKGIGELYGIQLRGWFPWLLRLFFFLRFMPSRRQMLRVFMDWILHPFGGHDLSSIDYEQVVKKEASNSIANKREELVNV
ncbi:NAD(P)/FAD-dependent oxidoreductase [Paenibacillus sp. GCM10012307]|uniref:FAD-dependent oxidoreductase n=1 Tax=Paenibacillus roseus TaxID=2798579 RepID=A0A934J8Q7_9BACL|nr:FAD-dependent oxidoreductase [Paenibacillus roseus]MBJ6362497.1 FAD-dependent oxidoreductase [Paenibacillus roseus]